MGTPIFGNSHMGKHFFYLKRSQSLGLFQELQELQTRRSRTYFFHGPPTWNKKHGIPPWVSGYRKWCGFKLWTKVTTIRFFHENFWVSKCFLFPLLNASQVSRKKTPLELNVLRFWDRRILLFWWPGRWVFGGFTVVHPNLKPTFGEKRRTTST